MTKIKNTKKGMAKKTLSISLAVAMLATSNVPVWAAEFTDGTDAAFTSEAVVETPVEEVVTDAPVVEEEVAEDAKAATTDSQTSARLQNVVVHQNGWASKVTVDGKILKANLKDELKGFNYQWMVKNGDSYRAISNKENLGQYSMKDMSWFIPGAENVGKDMYLHIWYQNGSSADNIDVYLPAGTVAREDLTNRNADNATANFGLLGYEDWDGQRSAYTYEYNQTEIKPSVDGANFWVKFDATADNVTPNEESKKIKPLTVDDFTFSYSNPSKGNLIDADNECEVIATPIDSTLYTGVFTQKYRIVERTYKNGDLTVKIKDGVEYEYTGAEIVPAKEDILLTETIRKTEYDSTKVIDQVWTEKDQSADKTSYVGTTRFGVSINPIPNYKKEGLPAYWNDDLVSTYKVVARDLSKCTAEIDAVAGKDFDTLVNNGKIDEYIHIYDAEGNSLNLKLNKDYELVLPEVNPDKNGTYNVSIKAKKGQDNTKNFISTTLTITTHDFANAHFIDSNNHSVDSTADQGLLTAVPYTGETVSKDLSKYRFANWVDGKYQALEEGKDYKVTFAGVNAGNNKGRIIVEGLETGSYTGAKKVLYFDITPAEVHDDGLLSCKHDDVKVASKVVFDRKNDMASDYAEKINVSVKAHNTATPEKEFTLVEGKDYEVKYKFDTRNELGATITTTVTITNPNFQGKGKVFTETTKISRRQLSNCTMEVVGTYTYTGAAILPKVVVKDGNEVLVEGVDYKVVGNNNINVGDKAVVTVIGIDENEDGDGIYDPESSLSKNFTITPADAKDIEVEFAHGNTGIQYTGKAIKPTIVAVKLNGNDVTEQFDISYPGTYINVGPAMVTLTPVTNNFTGVKDATFNIIPRDLTGTLTVYDKDGQKYTLGGDGYLYDTKGKKVTFDYDGEERTFADAEFKATGNYAKYVTENDYEIKYADNVYGGTAYIYVEGKGNFAGTDTITDAEGGIINSVVKGTAARFIINTYKFKEQHVVIGDAEYAAGQTAKPNVTVTVFGDKLVEGKDYILHYDNRVELTNGKTQKVTIEGIKAFAGSKVEGYYAVVKRDLKNTDVIVTEKGSGYDVVVKNTGVVVPESEYTVEFNGNESVTVTAKKDSKYYTGSQTKDIEKEEIVKPAKPFIKNVEVVGNSATVVLADMEDDAKGYDYVISTDPNCTENKNYDDVIKNQLNKDATFQYAQTGVYYAFCHSWVRDENGQKLFSDWSEAYPFAISAITPDQPKITSVKVKGSTVTVTYTKTANASGYDVVLGSEVKKVGDSGEKRPVNYGTLVKKNIKGNTVTATFKNVPKGTYYAGMHAFNRTRTDNKKVFSPWSESKKVTVK